MKATKMKIIFWKLMILIWINLARGSISGISYMDPIKISSITTKFPPGENPCNPLYWYPKTIPDYCNTPSTVKPASEEPPLDHSLPPAAPPILVPIMPPPVPIMPPPVPIIPPPVPILPPPMPILPPPMAILSSPPLVAGAPSLPLFPLPPMITMPSNTYTYSLTNPISAFPSNVLPYHPSFQQPPTGFVPGIPGLVTKDGGINIMPFSDTYADMLEKHKNKIIRRKLHKIMEKYENYPYSRSLRRYEKYFTED